MEITGSLAAFNRLRMNGVGVNLLDRPQDLGGI